MTVEGTLILPSGTTVEQIKNLGLKGNGSVKIDGSEYSLNGVKHEPNPDQWIHDTTHHWHPCRVDGCDLPQDFSTPESHIFGEWTTTKEPTHTQEGEKERSCICGEKQTESIPKLSGDDSQPDQPSKPSKTKPAQQAKQAGYHPVSHPDPNRNPRHHRSESWEQSALSIPRQRQQRHC